MEEKLRHGVKLRAMSAAEHGMKRWRNEEETEEKDRNQRTCSLLTPYASAQTLSGTKQGDNKEDTREVEYFYSLALCDHFCPARLHPNFLVAVVYLA